MISELIESAPGQPGAYVFKEGEGKPIYVGKAGNLRKRLKSYLKTERLDPKSRLLMENAVSVDYTVTDSESEALLLEYNLIKEYNPKYNVRFRDDKRYPYFKITNEKYPRIIVTRTREADGGRYFGPYPDGFHARKMLKTLSRFFGFRTCKEIPDKPCLNLQIKKCVSPCVGAVSEKEYQELVEEAALYLKGDTKRLEKLLVKRMRERSELLDFEGAAGVRDTLVQVKALSGDVKLFSKDSVERDYVGYALEGGKAGVSVFVERKGRMVGHFFFRLSGGLQVFEGESVSAFIRDYYQSADIPKEVVVSAEFEVRALEAEMSRRAGRKVSIRAVKRGRLRRMIKLVERNARVQLVQKTFELGRRDGLGDLAKLIGFRGKIGRVEGFDVSNISGTDAVGSMVVFEGGKPNRSEYRRFKIKTVAGANDVAMMREVISRRLGNDWPMPDVILVDGGRGQVNAALKVLSEAGKDISVIGLAKEEEDLYLGGREGFLSLPKESAVMTLLRAIRDEAHRFALTYHRKLRGKIIPK